MTICVEVNKRDADIVSNGVKALLDDRFKDEDIAFGPIIVEPRIDHDGDEYIKVHIVFDGDRDVLDAAWTVGLIGLIRPLTAEIGYPNVPSRTFIEKSEWENLRKTGIASANIA